MVVYTNPNDTQAKFSGKSLDLWVSWVFMNEASKWMCGTPLKSESSHYEKEQFGGKRNLFTQCQTWKS